MEKRKIPMQTQISPRGNFILLSVAHAIHGLCWIAPLLLPLIREELHLTYTQGGLLLASYSLVLSVFTMVSGHLGDIWQPRKLLCLGFLLTLIAFCLMPLTQSYLQILAILALVAVGVSIFYPVAMAWVSRGWPKGIFFGLFEAAGTGGVVLATLLFYPLVVSFGWRLAVLILALPSLPIALVFLSSRINLRYQPVLTTPRSSSPKVKSVILFYVARGIQIFGGTAVISFMPLFAVDVAGFPVEKASLFPLLVWAGGVPATLIHGILSDIWSPLKIILVLTFLVVPIVLTITLSLPLLTLFPLLAVIGFCTIGAWVPQNMWLSRVTLEKTRGKVFGGAMSLGSVANISSPVFFGFIADKWGLVAAYRLTVLPMMIGAILLVRLLRNSN